MIRATLSDRGALLLLRLRWLAWGVIVALLAINLAAALHRSTSPELDFQPQSASIGQIAGSDGGSCVCLQHNHIT